MKPNKYRGQCVYCGAMVERNAGMTWRERGHRRFSVAHLACIEADSGQVVEFRVSDGYGGYRSFKQNARGRCEDAPCCGCCD